jgi:hypothetical protein
LFSQSPILNKNNKRARWMIWKKLESALLLFPTLFLYLAFYRQYFDFSFVNINKKRALLFERFSFKKLLLRYLTTTTTTTTTTTEVEN